MGIRINGRLVIRPQPGNGGKAASVYNVGTVVDVWWHDGWWEGIVLQEESGDKLRVFLPGLCLLETPSPLNGKGTVALVISYSSSSLELHLTELTRGRNENVSFYTLKRNPSSHFPCCLNSNQIFISICVQVKSKN